MNPNLTTAYMAGDIERGLLETKANKQRLIDEAMGTNAGHARTTPVRHRIALLLMRAGARLDGQTIPVYQPGFDDSLHPAR